MEGKIAVVTGAGRGIGRDTAVVLAKRGVRVMAVSRTEAELVSLREEIDCDYVVESVSTPEGCARIVDETQRRVGAIDILVNNAGLGSYRERPIAEMTSELWHETLSTNLDGPFELTRRAVGPMMQRGWGRVIMVSSTAGVSGGASMPAYCASKHGLVGLMRAVAQDVARFGVTCNAVLPGWVRTFITEKRADAAVDAGVSREQFWEERAREYPAGRIVEAREVAEAIVFLAEDRASGINGEIITVSLGGAW